MPEDENVEALAGLFDNKVQSDQDVEKLMRRKWDNFKYKYSIVIQTLFFILFLVLMVYVYKHTEELATNAVELARKAGYICTAPPMMPVNGVNLSFH